MILGEGNLPYPSFPKCNMYVLQRSINGRHPSTDLCCRGEERKCHQLAEEEAIVGAATEISAYVSPLAPIYSFNYLGRVLSMVEDYCPAVV